MYKITNITDNPKQQFSFPTDNGKLIKLKLYFISSQIGWFFDVEYDGIVSTCHRVTNCPNIIREKKNIFPFGIACSVNDGQEPWFVDDFLTGRATLYIVPYNEVLFIEKEVYGKVF